MCEELQIFSPYSQMCKEDVAFHFSKIVLIFLTSEALNLSPTYLTSLPTLGGIRRREISIISDNLGLVGRQGWGGHSFFSLSTSLRKLYDQTDF